MKLVRFGDRGAERPGIMHDTEGIIDVSSFVEDYDPYFFETDGIQKLEEILEKQASDLSRISSNTRLGAPITQPGKILCVGLNYSDHARETGKEIPAEPVLFSKAVTALNGPFDTIEIPRGSKKTDWEVELAFVIGKKTKYVHEANAYEHIAGYAIMNDVSEREFQAERCGQWVKGKSHDTFAPFGPYLVTPDELSDVQNVSLYLDVNGQRMQSGNTKSMIFNVKTLLSYISQFMTLMPGDIISTGTPPGVGAGMNPPMFLKPGDVVELGVEGLGSQRLDVVASE